MTVTQSVQDLQVIEGGKKDRTPDHLQGSPDYTPDYTPDHSPEVPSAPSDLPDRLWSVGELAKRYNCSNRTVQKMVKFVEQACPHDQLKARQSKRSMYTARCVERLDSLHQAKQQGIDSPQWVSDQLQQARSQAPSLSNPENDAPNLLPSPTSGELAVVTGIVPSEIALATDAQQTMLDSAIARFTPQKTHLNGNQESNLAGIELLIGAVDQAIVINDQRQSALNQRESTVDKSEQVLDLVRDRLQTEQTRTQTLNRQETAVAEREQVVNELLGKLGISSPS